MVMEMNEDGTSITISSVIYDYGSTDRVQRHVLVNVPHNPHSGRKPVVNVIVEDIGSYGDRLGLILTEREAEELITAIEYVVRKVKNDQDK